MRTACLLTIVAFVTLLPNFVAKGESIDGRVIQVQLPVEDATLLYVEAKGGMTIELSTKSVSVIGPKLYLGDGKVAVELAVHVGDGIVFQGETKLDQGFVFRKYSVVEVKPGYRKAADLSPGDVYVTFPGVTFKMPK